MGEAGAARPAPPSCRRRRAAARRGPRAARHRAESAGPAASPLLLLAGQLRGSRRRRWTSTGCGITRSRRSAGSRNSARAAGIPNEIVMAARYALCAGLDEAVLSTPWGAQSDWSQHPLLVALHREAWGGEKFFDMLDRDLAGSRPLHRSDGAAVSRVSPSGSGASTRCTTAVTSGSPPSSRISIARSATTAAPPPADLSLRWRGLEDRRNPLIRYVPWWVVGAAALAILRSRSPSTTRASPASPSPVHARAREDRTRRRSTQPPTAPVSGPTLKQLLAPEEARGALRSTSRAAEPMVTLLARESVRVGQRDGESRPRTTRCSASRRRSTRFPGRVLVVGHTDDQPMQVAALPRQLRALARARAQRRRGAAARPSTTTRGSAGRASAPSQPLYRPAPIRRTARATGASKSFTSAGA